MMKRARAQDFAVNAIRRNNRLAGERQGMEQQIKELLRRHSVRYVEMALRTDRKRRIPHPDGYGKRKGVCGDTIEMFLKIDNDLIEEISFETDGCMNTIACANTVALLSMGKTIDLAWDLEAETIISHLGALPPEEYHCAELAVGALYLALQNYQETKRSSWKKIYGA